MRPSPGVTLVELVITVAVLAVGLAAAVPSFVDFFDKHRLRGAAEEVISLIANARAEAVRTDLDVAVAVAGAGTTWCIGANAATPPSAGNPAAQADTCDCTDAAACMVGGALSAIRVDTFPGVRVGSLPAAMVFQRQLGAIVPLGARTLTLTSPRGKYDLAVEVSPLGQAALCVPTGKPSMTGVAPC